MCLSPIRIRNNSTYKDVTVSPYYVEVPCGHCDECRSTYMSEWQTRISFELQSLYNRGGSAVFLTFTYDDFHLPHYTDGDFSCVCFSHDDVLSFLNRIKVSTYRKYGKHSYKYFFTCEYGKNTCRPHYHGLFFLESQVDYHWFVENCRKYWFVDNKLGFVFPKWSSHFNMYVDDYDRPDDPCIRSLAGGARYVSKYVTKDLSFYGLSSVSQYLEDKKHKERMKRFLPKHWQSNMLGYSVIDCINSLDASSVRDALEHGVYNPLFGRNTPFPRYAINKLMFRSVRSDVTGYPRKSDDGSHYLYDRELTTFGRVYSRYVFDTRLGRRCRKLYETFNTALRNDSNFLSVKPYLERSDISLDSMESFIPLALYHEVYRGVSSALIDTALRYFGGDFSSLFNPEYCFYLWSTRRDVVEMKRICSSPFTRLPDSDFTLSGDLLSDYSYLDSYFSDYSRTLATARCADFARRQSERDRIRRLVLSRYNKKYC